VLDLGTAPPRPVRVLAVISIESAGPSSLTSLPDHAFWADLFQAPARSVGAQAVVGLHAVQKLYEPNWVASALAVEYVDAAAPPDSCGCVLAVPDPQVHVGKKPRDRAEIADNLRVRLAVLCAERGWYPLLGDSAAAATLGHGVDARLALALDSLPPQKDVAPERARRVTTDPSPGRTDQVACAASLIDAAGDTLLATSRPASSTDLAAIMHMPSPDPRGPIERATDPKTPEERVREMQLMGRYGPRGPIEEAYWRAYRKELEALPGPSRAH